MPFDLIDLVVYGLPLLIAIPFHEAAHGFVAWRCGDPTARELGRVTFNPFKHIDPFGTLLLPGLLIASGAPFVFGWAKPVPVNFNRLRNRRRDSIMVALAGPGINLVLAILSVLVLSQLMPETMPEAMPWWVRMLAFSVLINLVLVMFNMLPLLPLDGGRVLNGLLPPRIAEKHAKTERFGMAILILLIIVPPMLGSILHQELNLIGAILMPPVTWLADMLFRAAGL